MTDNTMVKVVIRSRKYNDRQYTLTIVCYYIYGFWLPLWPLYCLWLYLRLLITPLIILLSVIIFMASDYIFDHCIVCHYIYGFWLLIWPLYYLSLYLRLLITPLTIVLSAVNIIQDNAMVIGVIRSRKYNDGQHNGQRCNQKP
jgi:hypothetical protein